MRCLNLSLIIVLTSVFFFADSAEAGGKAKTPTEVSGFTLVDAQKAKELVDAKSVTVIDVRKTLEYKEEHIVGAIAIGYKEKSDKKVGFDASKDSFAIEEKIADKATPLLIYCNGETCWKSYKASLWAHKAGYQTIYWLRKGIPEWKEAGFPTE